MSCVSLTASVFWLPDGSGCSSRQGRWSQQDHLQTRSPRNFLGGPDTKQLFAGAKIPEGKVPNLTPTRLKKWSDPELKEYLMTGNAPNGDVVVEPMSEVITNTTSQLNSGDIAAMIAYLRSLPPRAEAPK